MLVIRVCYQNKVLPEREYTAIKGIPLKLISGALAAVISITFSLEYIFAPGTFRFAYSVKYPDWLRWLGLLLLLMGITLLGLAHRNLDRSFSSFVAMKEEQAFVAAGPYRYIRHPI